MLVAFLPMRCLADRAAIKRDLATRARIERRILEAAEAALPGGSDFLGLGFDFCDHGGPERFRVSRRGTQLVRGS